MVGGVSDKDANALAKEMRMSIDFVRSMRKRESYAEFACWVKNVTERAIKLSVPFGVMEEKERLDQSQFQMLIQKNQARFGVCGSSQSPTVHQASRKRDGSFEVGEWDGL